METRPEKLMRQSFLQVHWDIVTKILFPAVIGTEQSPDFSERFQYICDFGAGGVGRVAKARDLVFDRVIAVKSLNESFQDNADAGPFLYRRMPPECETGPSFHCPCLRPGKRQGRTLESRDEVHQRLLPERFINTIRGTYDKKKVNASQERHALISRLEYFLKICAVVEYCHSLKIVHGDIKPDNILMGNFGEVYLMDWGMCAHIRHSAGKSERHPELSAAGIPDG